MAPSLRVRVLDHETPPFAPVSLIPRNSPYHNPKETTQINVIASNLRFNARVPLPGMHSSNHNSDAVRSALHLPNPRIVDLDPAEPLEFDGPPTCGFELMEDITVREMDIPPNPDDDDECPFPSKTPSFFNLCLFDSDLQYPPSISRSRAPTVHPHHRNSATLISPRPKVG
jgi:hypothetical protein